MELLDYIIILLYFLGLIAVSVVMSRKIISSAVVPGEGDKT